MIHNKPLRPDREFLSYIRNNYIYIEDSVYSLISDRKIGTKSNGCPRKDGYSRIGISIRGARRYFKYHHIVWYLNKGRWPKLSIDHIDKNRNNNKIENLREVTHKENCQNRGVSNEGKDKKILR